MPIKQRIIFLTIAASTVPFLASAASLSIRAGSSTASLNQPVRFDVALDTEGSDMNAIQGQVMFSPAQFRLEGIENGASPVTFWVVPPAENTSGTVTFSGIVPGGFQGTASSVVSLWLLPVASGRGTVSLENVAVLQNDGQASPLTLTLADASIVVSGVAATGTASVPISHIAPDIFVPIVSRDPDIYGGQYFLAFSTTDKGSGIDHYEVMEVPTGKGIGETSPWRTAVSPYLLQDQSLGSDIYVRAVDHAGNFIVVTVRAAHPNAPTISHGWNILAIAIASAAALIIVTLAFFLFR